ncbi:hypothetical protein [Corynebacterium anserum]|uniref:hypothetical protein n=1 Tax=Corynebacterium anserum TaxID=2684406 RepID=UPI001C911293|nr:hypothetical protein [Corynebacterium anserum]
MDYRYHQDICITKPGDLDQTFAVIDLRDDHGDYSPEATLATVRTLTGTPAGQDLPRHIPHWDLAEPLGLLALAVREYFTGSVVRELTQKYVKHLAANSQHPESPLAYGRLAYSVSDQDGEHCSVSNPSPVPTPAITLHACEGDPLFFEETLEHLVDRAQAFATVLGSTIDCREVLHTIKLHRIFPSTIHEPDAVESPINLYKIPLCVDLFNPQSFPEALHNVTTSPETAPTHTAVVLHRDSDSGTIQAEHFIPGKTLVDRSIQCGGYLNPDEMIARLQRECSKTNPGGLAAQATDVMLWESLATWGFSPDAWWMSRVVRAVRSNYVSKVEDSVNLPLVSIEVDAHAPSGSIAHGVCDVLDALGIESSVDFPVGVSCVDDQPSTSLTVQKYQSGRLPCLWPRALGAWRHCVTDQAIALAVARRALCGCALHGVSWIGVEHTLVAQPTVQHRITLAVECNDKNNDNSGLVAELTAAVSAVCATHLPHAQVECKIVDAHRLTNPRQWCTVAGYHPVTGFLPAYAQLERREPH